MTRLHSFLLYSLSFALLTFASCKTTQVADSDGSIPNKSPRFLISKMEKTANDFQWFEGKAKIKYIDMTQNRSIKANIRIKKGEMIWLSATLFGIEGMRVKITPDSVHIIDRINKQYIVQPLDFIQERFKLPADYSTVEAMLVGNPVVLEGSEFTVAIKDQQYHLNTKNPVNATYVINGRSYQLEELVLQDGSNQKVNMAFKEYETTDDKRTFSFLRDVLVSSPTKGNASVEMNFTKVQFDVEKEMSFNVPSSYKVVK